ncbi:hypothetical protein [Trebonia kvetii]|uniref:hypothetical protein n=1 Tax=Trebonia kvetii TaxID=2480626 RepID=UPI001FED03A5|nr:hypothetical protein [Trebonia kvetii]
MGDTVGVTVGATVGDAVGVTVGEAVGVPVGAVVGEEAVVGDTGACVGCAACVEVPPPCDAALSNWYRLYSRINAIRLAPYSGSVA